MYIILVYDIATKQENNNSNQIRKLVEKYLTRTQYSVYEGDISEAKYKKLFQTLKDLIEEIDSVVIYRLNDLRAVQKDIIGIDKLKNIFS